MIPAILSVAFFPTTSSRSTTSRRASPYIVVRRVTPCSSHG